MGMPGDKNFAASADSQHSFISSAQRDTIILKGVRVDTIVECKNACTGDLRTIQKGGTVETLREALTPVESFVPRGSKITRENRANAVWRIPIANHEFSPGGMQSYRRATAISQSQYRGLRKALGMPIDGGNNEGGNGTGLEFGSYLIRMNEIHNSRPFLSDKGYVGLVPADTQIGDLICISFGAPVPFVLRKKGGQYQLIGEAYVYGIMDGEFLATGDAVPEEFALHCLSSTVA